MLEIECNGRIFKIPKKIVVVETYDFRWNFLLDFIPIDVSIHQWMDPLYQHIALDFDHYGEIDGLTWVYLFELKEFKYISYEKFLKLKAFI